MESYEQKKNRLTQEIRCAPRGAIRLGKTTSNLFRDRENGAAHRLEVGEFDTVLNVDPAAHSVEVEGMTSYEALVAQTLPHGVMPAVVPQLKSITIGGAVSGVGIESSSFRYGLPHETVTEMDVLLGHGEVITCRPDNEHRELFFGLPNSYGTLGYILKLTALTVPVKPYVHIEHHRVDDPDTCFRALAELCAREDVDFVDGTVFDRGAHYLSVGRFVDDAPCTSDYTYLNIYYRSISERDEDYLTTRDYLWRWDTDWFWCSKNLHAQAPLVRRLLGRKRLGSVTYAKVMRLNGKWGLTRTFNRLAGKHPESIIQDVDIPIGRAGEFLDFFHREIGIKPIWICPIRCYDRTRVFGLYPLDPDTLYVNFGFWDVVANRDRKPPGHFNRLIERKVTELGGLKSLYSDSYFSEDEFWSIYNRDRYLELKNRYDPELRLTDLYRKTVQRQ